jgi:ABC-type hemin transport system substrate-binding protein
LKQIKAEQNPIAIICDEASPARSLIPELEAADIEVRTLTAKDHADACGKLVDAVKQKTLRHLGSPEVNAALKGAAQRSLGESWGWGRRSSSVDITPLVAFTLAHWAATSGDFDDEILVAFV